MVIGHKDIEEVKALQVDNATIDRVSEVKFLSRVDPMLKKIKFFGNISKKLDKSTRILICNTIVAPHFSYCSTILYLSKNTHIERLQKQQRKSLLIIRRKITSHSCERSTWGGRMVLTKAFHTFLKRSPYILILACVTTSLRVVPQDSIFHHS